MGMFLIIWDKLFGTFEPETKDEPIQYGLTTKVESNNPLSMIFHEWKNIARDLRRPVSWKDKFLYLFGPPGWSHDGSRLTSNQLREREKELLEKTSGKVIVESMQEEAIAV